MTSHRTPCSARWGGHQPGVARGDPLAVNVLDARGDTGLCGIAEGRGAETQRYRLERRGTGVQQEVTTGDPAVQGARADIDSDVSRAQEEELDVVVDIGQHELLGVATTPVTSLAQHLGGGLGQRALVGHGDS